MKITIEQVKKGLEKHNLQLNVGCMIKDNNCCAMGAALLSEFDTVDIDCWELSRKKWGDNFVSDFWRVFDNPNHYNCLLETEGGKNALEIREQCIQQGLLNVES